jgi:hypothetical protein
MFATQAIARGTVVWEYEPGVDYLLYHPPIGRLADWAWREADAWVVPGDDARFINHAATQMVFMAENRKALAQANAAGWFDPELFSAPGIPLED